MKPTKRNVVIRVFRSFGFTPVGNQGRHSTHLKRGQLSIAFPTYKEFSVKLLLQMLKEADITREQWEEAQ